MTEDERRYMIYKVLNLIITGIPSILLFSLPRLLSSLVLNLIITGIPSILNTAEIFVEIGPGVLNLIITGIPSIHGEVCYIDGYNKRFKPYYNWNTFNTK